MNNQSATTTTKASGDLDQACGDTRINKRIVLLRYFTTTRLEFGNWKYGRKYKLNISTAPKLRNVKYAIDGEWLGIIM